MDAILNPNDFTGKRFYWSLFNRDTTTKPPRSVFSEYSRYVVVGRRPLRSNCIYCNDMWKLLVPRTHNKLGDRSFSAVGPRLWNDLPPGLRLPGLTFDSFRKSMKTHLFGDRSAYSDSFECMGAI